MSVCLEEDRTRPPILSICLIRLNADVVIIDETWEKISTKSALQRLMLWPPYRKEYDENHCLGIESNPRETCASDVKCMEQQSSGPLLDAAQHHYCSRRPSNYNSRKSRILSNWPKSKFIVNWHTLLTGNVYWKIVNWKKLTMHTNKTAFEINQLLKRKWFHKCFCDESTTAI
jgi:hypothetical protein